MKRRAENDRNRSGFDKAERVGDFPDAINRLDYVRTERAAVERRSHHAIAGAKFFHARSNANDTSTAFVAELRRLAITQRINAEDLHQVAKVQPSRGDFDLNFAASGSGSRAPTKLE